jgi:YjbE family integral membrane protein
MLMDMLAAHEFWVGLLMIVWANLILSGDNAVVIALASRSLPPEQAKKAIVWGSGAAIALRVVLTVFAVALLALPWLKVVGGLALLWVGIQLLGGDDDGEDGIEGHSHLFQAIKTILIADLVMSLDNVIAVAGVAEAAAGSIAEPIRDLSKYVLLVIGLGISIPIVIFGSTLVMKAMERFPIIVTLGAALLGFIAGEMAVTDPATKGWVGETAPWLASLHVAGLIGAVLVIVIGKGRSKPAAAE